MNGKNWMSIVLLSSVLAACGGGGGSTAGTNSVATGGGNFAARSSGIVYYEQAQGSLDAAPISTTNHAAFVDFYIFSVIESLEKAQDYVLRPTDTVLPAVGADGRWLPPAALSPGQLSEDVVTELEQDIVKKSSQAARSNYGNSGTIPCVGGGNMVLTGNIDTNSTEGTIKAQYTDCINEDGTLRRQGIATVDVIKRDPTNGIFVDFIVNYERLSIASAWGHYFVYEGSQHVTKTLVNGDYRKSFIDTDLERDDEASYIYLDYTKNTVDAKGLSSAGRICHGNYGCVDIETTIPLSFERGVGEINMKGANNSSIQLYYDKITRTLHTRIDGHGNGAFGAPIAVSDLL